MLLCGGVSGGTGSSSRDHRPLHRVPASPARPARSAGTRPPLGHRAPRTGLSRRGRSSPRVLRPHWLHRHLDVDGPRARALRDPAHKPRPPDARARPDPRRARRSPTRWCAPSTGRGRRAFLAASLPAARPRPALAASPLSRRLERSSPTGARRSGKRMGLVAHPASITADGRHAVDVLREHGLDLVRLFAPEHGLRGDAAAGEECGAARPADRPARRQPLRAQTRPGAADLAGSTPWSSTSRTRACASTPT